MLILLDTPELRLVPLTDQQYWFTADFVLIEFHFRRSFLVRVTAKHFHFFSFRYVRSSEDARPVSDVLSFHDCWCWSYGSA